MSTLQLAYLSLAPFAWRTRRRDLCPLPRRCRIPWRSESRVDTTYIANRWGAAGLVAHFAWGLKLRLTILAKVGHSVQPSFILITQGPMRGKYNEMCKSISRLGSVMQTRFLDGNWVRRFLFGYNQSSWTRYVVPSALDLYNSSISSG